MNLVKWMFFLFVFADVFKKRRRWMMKFIYCNLVIKSK